MKSYKTIAAGVSLFAVLMTTACSDFEDLNRNPRDASITDVKVEYFLNKSIMGAQQDPHIAERMFILTWKYAARFERGSGFALGSDNNGWMTDYCSVNYAGGWLNNVNTAVAIGEEQLATGTALPHTRNALQIARIWRAEMYAQLACGFGPAPINGEYKSEKEVFYFVLSELKDAATQLDPAVDMSALADLDAFYGGNVRQWIKYAHSLRMRYAMLLSEVDPAKAKEEFEDAAKGDKILLPEDIARVAEKDGWDELTGVMTRSWNAQTISVTFNNLVVGLGGQAFDVPADSVQMKAALKDPQTYLGVYLDKHLPLTTNDPCAGYFFDALPSKIDPRATKLFNVPGYRDPAVYYDPDIAKPDELASTAKLYPVPDAVTDTIEIKTRFAWSAWVAGTWDRKAGYSTDLIGTNANYPRLSKAYRYSTNKRVWFAPWETNFLLAEAALYGWAVGGDAKSFYEAGIRASFEYLGVAGKVDAYLTSRDYNRVGTSVDFDHTTEATPFSIQYIDGYTGESKTATYHYPVNSIYKGGTANNDHLAKIITQKYLAFVPWQPLDAWNDQRRLGLPFMENQAVETDYSQAQVPLTKGTAKECRLEFYPKRYRYPTGLGSVNPAGYAQAIQLLGGPDKTTTPLWWSKR
ncbi:MAG: SusD/RagB family nutrient-binding outer membrane lipoprotein [Dysgonamonadaceae bacterium]|jgi:hypothetical protein|nr:SusD/RagB family nutrient-binding outer membrane lipoprotein [Dysgonamonadaceae bacterium]